MDIADTQRRAVAIGNTIFGALLAVTVYVWFGMTLPTAVKIIQQDCLADIPACEASAAKLRQ